MLLFEKWIKQEEITITAIFIRLFNARLRVCYQTLRSIKTMQVLSVPVPQHSELKIYMEQL